MSSRRPEQVWQSRLRASLARRTLTVCLLLCTLLTSGCHYTIGNGFAPQVRTVYVPIFTSDADRRGLEFQLTEAVQKEIQLRTPFRIVDEPNADTQLTGHVVGLRKRVLGETRNDDPRELQISLQVQVRWENLRTGEIMAERDFTLNAQDLQVIQRAEFAPEVGQSLASASKHVMDRTARRIVDLMEQPNWEHGDFRRDGTLAEAQE